MRNLLLSLFDMPELSIVVPVLDERDNIAPLIHTVRQNLTEVDWEILFVDDDSPDGTANVCRAFALQDPQIRILQRIHRTGLASACVEGMLATSSPWIAVMDGDLQHDPAVLPSMLALAEAHCADLVVGSRYLSGECRTPWFGSRLWLSRGGRTLSRSILKVPITDPMSGFFVISQSYFLDVVHDLSLFGFKILVDIISSSRRPPRLIEVPFTFVLRTRGTSKLDVSVLVAFAALVAEKRCGNLIPMRFVLHLVPGVASGSLYFAAVLALKAFFPALPPLSAQAAASTVAMLSGFILYNSLALEGHAVRRADLLRGSGLFLLLCIPGLLLNLAVAAYLGTYGIVPWLAGGAGMSVSIVWSHAATFALTWAMRRRSHSRQSTASAACEAPNTRLKVRSR